MLLRGIPSARAALERSTHPIAAPFGRIAPSLVKSVGSRVEVVVLMCEKKVCESTLIIDASIRIDLPRQVR